MLRVVIDTNVLVSALRSQRGASFRLLSQLGDPRWQPAISVALVLEYEGVLEREARRLGIPAWVAEALVDQICKVATPHLIYFRLRPESTDPDDDFVLELAVGSRADCIVTYNVRDFKPASRFGIVVVTPGEFLARIGARP